MTVIGRHRPSLLSLAAGTAFAVGVGLSPPTTSLADEGGTSFWQPGTYGSLAAVPPESGWSFAVLNYYTSASAGGAVAAAREITIGRLSPTVNVNLNVNFSSKADSVQFTPSYVFATPVLGGQLAASMTGLIGRNLTGLDGTLTIASGPFAIARQGSLSGSVAGLGDLSPEIALSWNKDVNNWMVYGTGNIPVGAYSPTSLANLGIGHGAVDAGGGYTYFNPQTGKEFSAVTGLTYNLVNPSTDYQNGVDWHLDWAASQLITKQIYVGAVGYFYEQLSADGGAGDHVGPFYSGVIGVGPQVNFTIPAGTVQADINLKAYWEFDARNRPAGWNGWLTVSLSPSAPASPRCSRNDRVISSSGSLKPTSLRT